MILQIALDTPLRRVFDYRAPAEFGTESGKSESQATLRLGVRVRVPFGRRQMIGTDSACLTESRKRWFALRDSS